MPPISIFREQIFIPEHIAGTVPPLSKTLLRGTAHGQMPKQSLRLDGISMVLDSISTV